MNFNDPRVPARVWAKILPRADGHWEWTGARGAGDCQMRLDGRTLSVKRFLFEIEHGPQAARAIGGCSRTCVRPEHQIAGTGTEVSKFWKSKQPPITHCPAGHDYAITGAWSVVAGRRVRRCRACASRIMAKWQDRQRRRRVRHMSLKRRRVFEARSAAMRARWKKRPHVPGGTVDS